MIIHGVQFVVTWPKQSAARGEDAPSIFRGIHGYLRSSDMIYPRVAER